MAKPVQKAFRYIVVYDIKGPNEKDAMRRRKRFHYRFKQFMTPIQRSVMEGGLTPTEVDAAIGLAAELIEPAMDTVKFYRQQASTKKEAPVAVLGTATKLKLSDLAKKAGKKKKAPKKNAGLTRRQRARTRRNGQSELLWNGTGKTYGWRLYRDPDGKMRFIYTGGIARYPKWRAIPESKVPKKVIAAVEKAMRRRNGRR